jgi:general secretion pathway protein K
MRLNEQQRRKTPINQMLRPAANRGIALISVLWVVALLAVVAGGMSAAMQDETRLVRNLLASAQARHAAEGGVQLALLALASNTGQPSWQADGAPRELAIGDAAVRVTVIDEAGKIDLNAAQDGLLDGLLKTAELEDWQRRSIVDAILDWRDTDNLTRLNGAEDDDYLSADKPYGTKDTRFDSVDELYLVLGVSPALYRKIKSALTVYSGQPGVNPAAASRQVLLAIPGMDADTVETYMALRQQHREAGLAPPPPPLTNRQYIARGRARTYSIHAQARVHNGVTAHITATVDRRGRDLTAPFTVLSWRQEGDELFLRAQDDG